MPVALPNSRHPTNGCPHQTQTKNTSQTSILPLPAHAYPPLFCCGHFSPPKPEMQIPWWTSHAQMPHRRWWVGISSTPFLILTMLSHRQNLIHCHKCAFYPLVEEIMTLSITPLLLDLLNYLKCQDNVSPACFHSGTSFLLNYVGIHWFPSTGSNGTPPGVNTNLLIQ